MTDRSFNFAVKQSTNLLSKAFEGYLQHRVECAKAYDDGAECSCGLDALKTAGEKGGYLREIDHIFEETLSGLQDEAQYEHKKIIKNYDEFQATVIDLDIVANDILDSVRIIEQSYSSAALDDIRACAHQVRKIFNHVSKL